MAISTSNPGTELIQSVRVFLHLGLIEFWRFAMPTDGAAFHLLELEATRLTGTSTLPDWQAARKQMQDLLDAGSPDSPLMQLHLDYRLSLTQLFCLGLIGEVEASYVINLVVAELQQPEQSTRPRLHLLSAMLDALFDDAGTTILDIAEQQLIQDRLIRLPGDEPLPLRMPMIDPTLWSILCGRDRQWPSCTALPGDRERDLPEQARNEIGKLRALLENSSGESAVCGVVVRGNPMSGRRSFAGCLAAELGLQAILIPLDLWREPAVAAACRYGGRLAVIETHVSPGEEMEFPTHDNRHPFLVLAGCDGAILADNCIEMIMPLPSLQERERIWNRYLDDHTLSKTLAASGLLSAPTIGILADSALRTAARRNEPPALSHVRYVRGRLGVEKLRLLSQPVHGEVGGEALIVPPSVAQGLNFVVMRIRQREILWSGLGTTLAATPTPGVRVLFVGESGTGKTLAASFIATELSAPLFRVDLSAVMNKYIGETEKNLAGLLDHAAANDVILLFDEADALFGKRTQGKETGDRYANMVTNFLLTRIEAHPGTVILTTNSRERIDNAFTRRIDSIVEFPLPGYEERLALWRSHLGDRGPGNEMYRELAAYCDFTGGQVRNAVLTAAVYAGGKQISRKHLRKGVNAEYNKLGRDMPAKLNRDFLHPVDTEIVDILVPMD